MPRGGEPTTMPRSTRGRGLSFRDRSGQAGEKGAWPGRLRTKGMPAAGNAKSGAGPVHHAATAITAPDTDHLPAYWQFHDAVAQAQLLAWLPRGRHMIVDVSGPRSPGGELAAMAGHHVLRVIERDDKPSGTNTARLIGDSSRLPFLPDE